MPELRVAHGALEVLLEVSRVLEDDHSGQEIVDIGVAVQALSHGCGSVGVDHDRRPLELVGQDTQIDVGHRPDIETKLLVALVAVRGGVVAQGALIRVGAGSCGMGLLGPILAVSPWP
jgi:hypothetical protein